MKAGARVLRASWVCWLLAVASAGCRSSPPPTAWRVLFDANSPPSWTSTDFGGQGEILQRDGWLELQQGSPLTGVHWTQDLPYDNYELEVLASRQLGQDFFCGLSFPVADQSLSLILGGWGGTLCGLSSIDGADAARNATRRHRHFQTGQVYRIWLQVTAAAIRVRVDDEELVALPRPGRNFSLRPELLPSQPLGVACFATTAGLHGLRWRPLGNGGQQ